MDWDAQQLCLLNAEAVVVKRWSLIREEDEKKALKSVKGLPDSVYRKYFWRVNSEGSSASSQAYATGDELYLLMPMPPAAGDLVVKPRFVVKYGNASELKASEDKLLQWIKNVDFQGKSGQRFSRPRKEFGSVFKSASFSVGDVMNASELIGKRRARVEEAQSKLVRAVESGENVEHFLASKRRTKKEN